MRSEPLPIIRLPSAGQYFVQTTDPGSGAKEGDIWWNPETGGVSVRQSGRWKPLKLSGIALMDACITNRLLAGEINAGKITTGRLESQNGLFILDLDTGEAVLNNLKLGGRVFGNVLAESNDGLMRIKLVGKNPDKDVSAQIAFEARDDADSEWVQKGLMWLGYGNHQSTAALQSYYVGTGYNRNRPFFALNASVADGIMARPYSQDFLRAAYVTYHGMRLKRRPAAYNTEEGAQYPWDDIPAINTASGNALTGETIEGAGYFTQSYTMNDVAKIDFNITITTAGSDTGAFGISRALLRQLNEEIPVITPLDGGTISVYSAAGALRPSLGLTFEARDGFWAPCVIGDEGELESVSESALTPGMQLTGTCYGRYTFNAEDENE